MLKHKDFCLLAQRTGSILCPVHKSLEHCQVSWLGKLVTLQLSVPIFILYGAPEPLYPQGSKGGGISVARGTAQRDPQNSAAPYLVVSCQMELAKSRQYLCYSETSKAQRWCFIF